MMRVLGEHESGGTVFHRFLASFTLVLIVPLTILGYLLYSNSVISVKEECRQLELQRVRTLQQLVDGEIRELERIALRVAQDPGLSPHTLAENQYNAYLARPLLRTHASSSRLDPDIFLGFDRSDLLFSSRGTLRLTTLLEYVYELPVEQWQPFLQATARNGHPQVIMPFAALAADSGAPELLSFVYTVPILARTQPQKIMFTVPKAIFVERIRAGGFAPGQVICAVDGNGRILLVDGFVAGHGLVVGAPFPPSAVSGREVTIAGERYYVATVSSEYDSILYATLTPVNDMYAVVRRSRTTSILVLSLVIVAGAALAAILSRVNYRPILQLRQRVRRDMPSQISESCRDEIEEIAYGIDAAVAERNNLSEQIRNQLPLVREQVLSMILRGETRTPQEVAELCSLCDIDLDSERYRAVAVSVPPVQRRSTTFRDIALAVGRVAAEAFPGCSAEIVEMYHDELAIIIGAHAGALSVAETEVFAAGLADRLKRRQRLDTTVGIGNIREKAHELGDSYLEALEASEHARLYGLKCAFFEELRSGSRQRHWHPVAELSRMSQALKQGNISGFGSAVEEIFAVIRAQKISMAMSRSAGFAAVNVVIAAVNELQAGIADAQIEKLASFESLEELEALLMHAGRAVCGYVQRALGERHAELRGELLEYIERNFRDPMLNLHCVADHFGFSAGHVGRLLREASGGGFADIVRRRRIAEAKRLLGETQKRVKLIVKEVGYADVANFIRTFRMMEGVTPLQYRMVRRNGGRVKVQS